MAKLRHRIDFYYPTRTKANIALRQMKKNLPSNLLNYNLSVGKFRDEYCIYYTRK